MKNTIDNADTSDKSVLLQNVKSSKRKIQKSMRIIKQFGLSSMIPMMVDSLKAQKGKDAQIKAEQKMYSDSKEEFERWNKYHQLDQF